MVGLGLTAAGVAIPFAPARPRSPEVRSVPTSALHRIRSLAVFSATVLAFTAGALAQTSAPAVQLQPYTAPDQSASAGVPAGWKVTQGAQTVIQMTGPQGETVFLGNTMVAKNAAFQLGQRGPNGSDLSMPYATPLAQKFTMIIQQGAVLQGKPSPQVTINSTTPIQFPAAFGQCARLVASATSAQGNNKIMAAMCSLAPDTNGFYKNMMLMAMAPAATAAQSAPTAAAIFQSYQIPAAMLQKKLAPFTLPAPPPSSGGGGKASGGSVSSIIGGEQSADMMATCTDLVLLRDTPKNKLPKECGGTAPD